ncbi:hypothetical protein V9K67_16375 [Paraflavisolibacter sp. H34]|uniref:hypothetical protein n=1 Tax=Huijunlia imazamoxiresistens TaxID=3127457 RepID=UPI003018C77B
MKALKASVFALLLSGMYLTSCQKDHDQQMDTPVAANSTKANNPGSDPAAIKIKEPEKLFERTLKVFDASKTKSTTLRLRASSQKTLDGLNLNDMQFTLVATPSNLLQQSAAPTSSKEKGGTLFSQLGATRDSKKAQDLTIPENAIAMDFPDAKNEPVSIEVSSKAKANLSSTDPAAQALATSYLYLSGTNWRRVQVTNLGYNAIYTAFYYHYWGYKYYSGYAYTLYNNGWSYYYNCNYSVGVNLTFYGAYRYRYTWWSNCY